jgi:hypothetical protein
VTVVVTVTWSVGPGVDGEILGVLMFGPGGGAVTMATAGSINSSERITATFFVKGDMFFPEYYYGAETYPSCNHEELIRKILSGCKVRPSLRGLELDEKAPEEVEYRLALPQPLFL